MTNQATVIEGISMNVLIIYFQNLARYWYGHQHHCKSEESKIFCQLQARAASSTARYHLNFHGDKPCHANVSNV